MSWRVGTWVDAYGVSEGVSFADGGGGRFMSVGVGLDIFGVMWFLVERYLLGYKNDGF